MTNEELNTALYQKMFAEQETYRKWLLEQPPEEILKHTYEYTVREDILLSLEYHDLTDAQTNALMKSPNPLGDVFHEFEQTETSYMDTVFDSMVRRADAVIQAEAEQRRILRETPLYPYPAGHAREHGELEQYCTSRKANIACKGAIEAAISEHYRDNRLGKEAALEVIDAFGMDRTLHVLAATVRHMDWDGRISRSNKEWAKTVPVFADMDAWGNDRNTELVVNSHPGLTDLFLSAARKEQHLRTPLCDEQIKAEAARLLSELQKLQEPNSPKPDTLHGADRAGCFGQRKFQGYGPAHGHAAVPIHDLFRPKWPQGAICADFQRGKPKPATQTAAAFREEGFAESPGQRRQKIRPKAAGAGAVSGGGQAEPGGTAELPGIAP